MPAKATLGVNLEAGERAVAALRDRGVANWIGGAAAAPAATPPPEP